MKNNIKPSIVLWVFALALLTVYANPIETFQSQRNPVNQNFTVKVKRTISPLNENKSFESRGEVASDEAIATVHKLQKRSPGWLLYLARSIGRQIVKSALTNDGIRQTIVETAVPYVKEKLGPILETLRSESSDKSNESVEHSNESKIGSEDTSSGSKSESSF